jgi:hypothetical protein
MPAGLEPAFWDAEKGAVKWDDLTKEVAALRTAKAEWENARSTVPESPDKYEFKLPEGFQVPEGLQMNPDDPRLPMVRKMAHEGQFTQKQFELLARMDAEFKANEMAEFNKRAKAEGEKLGPDGGKARVDAVTRGLSGALGEQMTKHLVPMMVGAIQVQAFEHLLSKLSAQGTATAGYAPGAQTPNKAISDDEWNRMSQTEKMTFAIENSAKAPAQKRA